MIKFKKKKARKTKYTTPRLDKKNIKIHTSLRSFDSVLLADLTTGGN